MLHTLIYIIVRIKCFQLKFARETGKCIDEMRLYFKEMHKIIENLLKNIFQDLVQKYRLHLHKGMDLCFEE